MLKQLLRPRCNYSYSYVWKSDYFASHFNLFLKSGQKFFMLLQCINSEYTQNTLQKVFQNIENTLSFVLRRKLGQFDNFFKKYGNWNTYFNMQRSSFKFRFDLMKYGYFISALFFRMFYIYKNTKKVLILACTNCLEIILGKNYNNCTSNLQILNMYNCR